MKKSERHPLEPFLPEGAVLLMLGSFPPKRERWSMEFYYPNLQNDMWRIFGWVFFNDKEHFRVPGEKRFSRESIAGFLQGKGIALCDTAYEVIRLQENASDKFLEVVTPVDLQGLLAKMPDCRTVATTGQKAAETLAALTGSEIPKTGHYTETTYAGRPFRIYRMPSSSRAYPRPVEVKAEAYRELFQATGLL